MITILKNIEKKGAYSQNLCVWLIHTSRLKLYSIPRYL